MVTVSSVELSEPDAVATRSFKLWTPPRWPRPLRHPDRFEGVVSDPATLHKYVYGNDNPVGNIDPSGNMSLAGTMLTAGVKAGLMSTLIGAPFRVYKAAQDAAAGASLRDLATDLFLGATADFALGAVLGGGAAGLVRQFGSNAFKIRTVGQSVGQFVSARVPWSAWRLDNFARGFAIENSILGRSASFMGQRIPGFRVIDDYIMRGGRGIATSIKSIDLTAASYQNPSHLIRKVEQFASKLEAFVGDARGGFSVGTSVRPIHDKILILAFEEGAATTAQANALIQFVRDATTRFPSIKLAVYFVP